MELPQQKSPWKEEVSAVTHHWRQMSAILHSVPMDAAPRELWSHAGRGHMGHISLSWQYHADEAKILFCYQACFGKITFLNVSVQFSHSVVSNSLWPHELQHGRPPCSSPTPKVYTNSCQLSQWCHPTISSSGIPFSSCPQSFLASGSFQMSQLFPSGQSIRVSASTSVLPMNTQDWSPLG